MHYLRRHLNIRKLLTEKSHFLLGPRQTGKTQLIRHELGDLPRFDLLDSDTFLTLAQGPSRLRELIPLDCKLAVIAEIQKLPLLLDEVHRLIEERGIHFLLTGSSARKLRGGGVNLLGGRARSRSLHPFVWPELEHEQVALMKVLDFGLLPSIYFSTAPREDLGAYVGNYLQLEIAAEGLTRNLPAFSRFLEVAAVCNTQLINYANISNDAQVPASTVAEYFAILRDTLIGFDLPIWKGSVKRKPIATSKFYFFDTGVARYLQKRSRLKEQSPELGEVFEAWIHHELRAYVDYHSEMSLHFWRTTTKIEVDFILNESIGIEVKAKTNISSKDLRGLKALREEGISNLYVVSLETRVRRVDDIEILPWRVFLDRLWADELGAPVDSSF